jgi:hypothetical protein
MSRIIGIDMRLPEGAEIPQDRFGRLSHSHITVFVPRKILDDPSNIARECPNCGTDFALSAVCPVCETTIPQEAKGPAHSIVKVDALKCFNRFLEAYRFYSKEYHVEPVKNADIIGFRYNYVMKGKTYPVKNYLIDTGLGGIRGGGAFILDEAVHEKFRDFLKQGNPIETYELLLCNSKNHLLTQEYPVAIIEAVSALEFVLSGFVRKECKTAGISDE